MSDDSAFTSYQRTPSDDFASESFSISVGSASHSFVFSPLAQRCLRHHRAAFNSKQQANGRITDSVGSTQSSDFEKVELSALFLQYLVDEIESDGCNNFGGHRGIVSEFIDALERDFLKTSDIHVVVSRLNISLERRLSILKAYYLGTEFAGRHPKTYDSFLWKQAKIGTAKVFAVCAGQGQTNGDCIADLTSLYNTYRPLLDNLVRSTSHLLHTLSQSGDTKDYFGARGLNIIDLLSGNNSLPERDFIASAPFSLPVIGLISLANYCVMCKVLNKSPGQARTLLQGTTGHSQGIVIAAVIAGADSWDSFYDLAKLAMEILFWIGYESHRSAPRNLLSGPEIQDCIDNSEGYPSPMLSVRGLSVKVIEKVIATANTEFPANANICISLVNSPDNIVISGSPKSLRGIVLQLRSMSSAPALDQSRISHSKRKPEIHIQFLPITAPFHTPYLMDASQRIISRLKSRSLMASRLAIPVFHTKTGLDIRQNGDQDVIPDLVRMITCDRVEWRSALECPGATHIIDFGPGRLSSLIADMKEGTGARTITVENLYSKCELYDPNMPSKAHLHWGETFGPRLAKTTDGKIHVETKLTKVLGLPPIIVAGMTPTTVAWDFVAAVSNAGYNVELAGGGYFSPDTFKSAILKLASNIPAGRGISLNLIYVNPHAIAWQIPLIRQLIQDKGVPVDSITIGAGVPSLEVATEYITGLGLKYIALKPGSLESIRQVIQIAEAHPTFPVMLQWTGGRGGGHHSYEDFHSPILSMYWRLRKCPNIILVAGSGFGGADDSWPYLSGEWSTSFGYPSMPFDGILLGSRMMVSKEAHTSIQAKRSIVETPGLPDSRWEECYDKPSGGIITVKSEMGQPIHKIANRGVLLWAEMDKMIFNLKQNERTAVLNRKKQYIIKQLNENYARPWFGKNASGNPVELENMTYGEILERLVELMFVKHQSRWIDASYRNTVLDWIIRIQERFPQENIHSVYQASSLDNPETFVEQFLHRHPLALKQWVSPQDVAFFLSICKIRSRKPVPFIPALDDDFEYYFKKDSLWQSEDVDAVVGQDVDRVCILQGPVSARYSKVVDEPAKNILDGIHEGYIERLKKSIYSKGNEIPIVERLERSEATETLDDIVGIIIEETPSMLRFEFSPKCDLPSAQRWFMFMATKLTSWAKSFLTAEHVMQGSSRHKNRLRELLRPKFGRLIEIENAIDASRTTIRMFEEDHELLVISCRDGINISADLFEYRTLGRVPVALPLKFVYNAPNGCPISQCHDERGVKKFYSKLWFDQEDTGDTAVSSRNVFFGNPITLTQDMVSSFMHSTGLKSPRGDANIDGEVVPMDIGIKAAWEALMKPLLIEEIEGDLLRLVHMSNGFRYLPGASPFQIGDTLQANSNITSVFIQTSGKVVEVSATINRNNTPVMVVTSSFLFKGSYIDFGACFRVIDEPVITLKVDSSKMEALLRGREWFAVDDSDLDILGTELTFNTQTRVSYKDKTRFSSLRTSGEILLRCPDGSKRKVGNVIFNTGECYGNPVIDFLTRYGSLVEQIVELKTASSIDNSSMRFQAPLSNELYGKVSGDYNPIHVSEAFSTFAGLPGTITHGMYVSAAVRRIAESWVAGNDPRRFKRYNASFTGMVLPGNQIHVSISHTGMLNGRKIFKIKALQEGTGDTVLEAEAEIEEPRTAYVFTGQGSQEKGMGMELYASSSAARDVWDRGDKELMEKYGLSILEIIRTNPKSLTIHFRGARGRRIRSNYLAMTIDVVSPSGEVSTEQILRDLKPDAESYTFTQSNGLLYSTQFAQPALTLMGKAIFEDMKSKGLVQDTAQFAGHSLGEYGALASMGEFMAIEPLVSVVFYRGLTMQSAMERDENGMTNFSMVAVNPGRVMKSFDEQALRFTVDLIAQKSNLLLEVVNLNVAGQQYLQNLQTLTTLLNQISASKPPREIFSTSPASPFLAQSATLHSTLETIISTSQALSNPITLSRGIATIPLQGIDVPFHSSYLLSGVAPYRKFLLDKIQEEDIDPKKLVGKYVPNLTAKPFSLEKSYWEETQKLTGSEVLQELLGNWEEIMA
ncbi:hypothetical protein B7494_g550 [Chlorociboria aeruginascens]|nr:hypothetical protein B7494_g550 [Chlorociboria aeruginascens]